MILVSQLPSEQRAVWHRCKSAVLDGDDKFLVELLEKSQTVSGVSMHCFVNVQEDENLMNLFHLVAITGRESTTNILNEWHAALSLKDAAGLTPIEEAKNRGHDKTAEIIKETSNSFSADKMWVKSKSVLEKYRKNICALPLSQLPTLQISIFNRCLGAIITGPVNRAKLPHFIKEAQKSYGVSTHDFVNAQISEDFLTLSFAMTMSGDANTAETLNKFRANFFSKNSRGVTPIQSAKKCGHKALARYMEERANFVPEYEGCNRPETVRQDEKKIGLALDKV